MNFPQCKVNLHDMLAYNFLQGNLHQVDQSMSENEENGATPNDTVEPETSDPSSDDSETRLDNKAKSSGTKYPPGDI